MICVDYVLEVWYNYAVLIKENIFQPRKREVSEVEAVIQTPASSARNRTPATKVREKLFQWARRRSDIRTKIAQCQREITLQARSASNTYCKSSSPRPLTTVQQAEFRDFVLTVGKELGLVVEPVKQPCSLGYNWETFKLTLPPLRAQ